MTGSTNSAVQRSTKSQKQKYTKQRQDDENIVNKAVKSGRFGKTSDKADLELQQIGAKVFDANHPQRPAVARSRSMARQKPPQAPTKKRKAAGPRPPRMSSAMEDRGQGLGPMGKPPGGGLPFGGGRKKMPPKKAVRKKR